MSCEKTAKEREKIPGIWEEFLPQAFRALALCHKHRADDDLNYQLNW